MENNNFKNRKILITGINGFIGKALEKRLNSLGAITYGISRSTGDNDRVLKSNVLDFGKINKFIKATNIQICFHLASEALVEEGKNHPYETFRVNTEGTLNILESARKNNLEKIIIASTSHVYGDNLVPYLEEYTPRPSRPYETSKACADIIAQSYADSFDLPVLIPRFANIYGPGDINFSRLIPKTIKSILAGKNPEMWGGTVKRQYLYIDDAIDAYLLLGALDKKLMERNRIYNFGTDTLITVKELMEKIIVLSGKNVSIKNISDKRLGEISLQHMSSSKAKRILGWKPLFTLDAGFRRTLSWYENYFSQLKV